MKNKKLYLWCGNIQLSRSIQLNVNTYQFWLLFVFFFGALFLRFFDEASVTGCFLFPGLAILLGTLASGTLDSGTLASGTLEPGTLVLGTLVSTVSVNRYAFAGSFKKSNSMACNREMSSGKQNKGTKVRKLGHLSWYTCVLG